MSLPPETPFVVFGDDWGRYPSTIQHTFRHIALRHPVVWVNGLGHRVPRLNLTDARRAWEKVRRLAGRRRVPDRSAVGTVGAAAPLGGGVPAAIIDPKVLPWHNLGFVHRINTHSLVRAINAQLLALGLDLPPVLVTGSPPSVGVLGRLDELTSIYYVLDDFLNFPTYTASMLAPLERDLLDRVDAVVATAASLTETKRPRSGRTFHLPQGVNYDHFARQMPEPEDLSQIPRPRIGLAGTLSTQCDLEILARLAVEFPDASLVIVGPVAFGDEELQSLRRPNVHILGVRPYSGLPAYVQHFDVGIIPYVISGWTVAVDPLKLLEYLAAGLPVVTTAIPEAAKYAGTVSVADSADKFVEAVRDALSRGRRDQAQGRAIAQANRWERRADSFLDIVSRVIADRNSL
ncbi:MAG TPA: glycosyltransferase [Gemmatimonadaceae bacterium]|nr:glycosyltransferase [Gemmatimonadaceae bacterium]HRQ77456.1 glycosyltransferase [Gemmatimonadaceae bacterium]